MNRYESLLRIDMNPMGASLLLLISFNRKVWNLLLDLILLLKVFIVSLELQKRNGLMQSYTLTIVASTL